jgi:RNA polymerase sigma factor (sigma-70 family)
MDVARSVAGKVSVETWFERPPLRSASESLGAPAYRGRLEPQEIVSAAMLALIEVADKYAMASLPGDPNLAGILWKRVERRLRDKLRDERSQTHGKKECSLCEGHRKISGMKCPHCRGKGHTLRSILVSCGFELNESSLDEYGNAPDGHCSGADGTGDGDEKKLYRPSKKRNREQELLARERKAQRSEARDEVLRAVSKLRLEYREIVRGYYWDGLDHRSIAESVGIDQSSVSRRKIDALASLRLCLPASVHGNNGSSFRHSDKELRANGAPTTGLGSVLKVGESENANHQTAARSRGSGRNPKSDPSVG